MHKRRLIFDKWMNGRMDGWMDGEMDGYIDLHSCKPTLHKNASICNTRLYIIYIEVLIHNIK